MLDSGYSTLDSGCWIRGASVECRGRGGRRWSRRGLRRRQGGRDSGAKPQPERRPTEKLRTGNSLKNRGQPGGPRIVETEDLMSLFGRAVYTGQRYSIGETLSTGIWVVAKSALWKSRKCQGRNVTADYADRTDWAGAEGLGQGNPHGRASVPGVRKSLARSLPAATRMARTERY